MKYISIALLFHLALFAASCANTEPHEPNEEVTTSVEKDERVAVRVAPLKFSTTAIPIRAAGMIATEEERKLAFKIGGVIQRVMVNEGQFVKKGQVLAQLNKMEINAQVRQANSGVEKAKRDLDRVNNLYADSVATLENVQDLTTALEVAQANQEIAQFNQKYATITAPTSGKILKRLSESNEIVGPGTPIFLFAANGSAQVFKVGLADVEIVKTRIGDAAEVRFDAYPNTIFTAKVTDIAELVNPRTGTYEVELAVNRKGKKLKNGFIGSAEITPRSSNGFYQIPMDAIVTANRESVTIYSPSTADDGVIQHDLQVVSIQPDYVAALPKTDDFQVEQVVTDGAKYLTKVSRIKIVE
ncbi:MAG: efflux RND transporter periplasmic adaptor subunit [Saprospiraceae bacterium]